MTARIAPLLSLTLVVLSLAACPNAPTQIAEPPPPVRTARVDIGEPLVVDAGPVTAPVAVRTLLDDEAIPAAADDETHHEEVGDALAALDKTHDAIVAYRTALSQKPSAQLWRKLGDAYIKTGDVERGERSLVESIAQDPLATDARRSLARVALDKNDGKRARELASELVARAADDVDAHRLLGRAYLQLSMWREAIGEMEKVARARPDDAYAHNNIGFAALQIGDLEKARDHLERCLSLEPQHGYMLNNLGVTYERLGRRAEAHAAFARAAELNPKYASAVLNRERVASRLSDEERIEAAETLLSMRTPPIDGGASPAGVTSDDGVIDAGTASGGGDADDAADGVEGGDEDGDGAAGGGSARLAPSP